MGNNCDIFKKKSQGKSQKADLIPLRAGINGKG